MTGANAPTSDSGVGIVDNPGTTPSSSGAGPQAPSTTQAPPATASPGPTRQPVSIDDCGANNPAGLSTEDAQKLRSAGTGAAGAIKWLYPYDGTVFPRGMLAPDLMWEGPAADAVFVHIKSKTFEYFGCLKPTAPGQLTLPQEVWDKAGQSTHGKEDIYSLEFSILSQGNVTGPALSHFQLAQASIKGSIYYNSYTSNLSVGACRAAAGDVMRGGSVLRIPPGGRAELFGKPGCNGCHSVSAGGSRLLSQAGTSGQTYELTAAGAAHTPVWVSARGAFGALYPDGSAYLSMSSILEVARTNNASLTVLPADAALFEANSGASIRNTGIPGGALMPMFAPDGAYLVFNDFAIDAAHGLAMMRYDVKTHTASEYKTLVREDGAGEVRPGWPFMLPDNHAVVYVRTDSSDFSGDGAGVTSPCPTGGRPIPHEPPFSELSVIDVGSQTVTLLANAMGYNTPADAAKGTTYLPFGEEELHHNYFPTVSPVAAGGYFWVFFDSLRHYGVLGLQRQLWGTAIDISPDGTYEADPSHPAFYLPGQEFGTGNHRAFAALDPCRSDGDKCATGIDCCSGFCNIEVSEELADPVGSCETPIRPPSGGPDAGPNNPVCAKRDERCRTDADCCPPPAGQPPDICIAGFCAFVPGPL